MKYAEPMRSLGLGGLAIAWLLVSSCGEKSQCQGAERCACYANETCNQGLECRSNLCIDLSPSSSGGTSASAGIDTAECEACAKKGCPTEADDCKASTGCQAIIDCILGCGSDGNCLAGCDKGATAGAISASLQYQSCAFSKCVSECVYKAPSSEGDGGDSASGPATGGAAHGGSASQAGRNTGGSSGGTAPVELTTGTNWLTLVSDAAPSTKGINAKLGVEGVFYAYADPCAMPTMQWDSVSRCVSGELCLGDDLGTNWGVAIGFDFNSVSDVKHAWNATAAGVQGLAWKTHSPYAYPMQVWVQNMDPAFGDVCSAASCSINGPPDGTSSASPNSQFLFSGMMKDYWGGTGTTYTFDPTRISSLQIKIPPATSSLDTSYSLCVDGLGVIR
jgi:hypothetical protein